MTMSCFRVLALNRSTAVLFAALVAIPAHLVAGEPPSQKPGRDELPTFPGAPAPAEEVSEDLPSFPGAPTTGVTPVDNTLPPPPPPAPPEWSTQAEAYRALLAELAITNERGGVLKRLAALEAVLLGEEPEAGMARLRKAELKVVRRLSRDDAEILLPILLLHRDTSEIHRRNGNTHLVLHSIQMVHAMATVYAKRADHESSRRLAADAVATLAGQLQRRGQLSSSRFLFEESLELDPANELARLGLALMHEKRGGPYDRAAHHLEELLENDASHREARLRLAMNLPRNESSADFAGSGADARCRSLLEGLLAEPEDDWVLSLAAQELARVHAKAGRYQDAIAVLEAAHKRLPHDQKLQIFLTYMHDRGRRPAAAQRLANGVSDALLASDVPRRRYNQWPLETLRRHRKELDRASEERRARLAAVVDAKPDRPEVH